MSEVPKLRSSMLIQLASTSVFVTRYIPSYEERDRGSLRSLSVVLREPPVRREIALDLFDSGTPTLDI